MAKSYRELMVWQKAMDLVEAVYRLTGAFPKEELYGLTSQMRRAAVSIPSNIAEGHGQGTDNHFARYLSISQGSLKELETQVLIAQRLGYVDQNTVQPVLGHCDEIGKMITGLQKTLKSR
jgi:four helix bundle protein